MQARGLDGVTLRRLRVGTTGGRILQRKRTQEIYKTVCSKEAEGPCQDAGQVDWVKELNGGQDIKVF